MGLLRRAALLGAGYVGYKYFKDGVRPEQTLRAVSARAQRLATEGAAKLTEASSRFSEGR